MSRRTILACCLSVSFMLLGTVANAALTSDDLVTAKQEIPFRKENEIPLPGLPALLFTVITVLGLGGGAIYLLKSRLMESGKRHLHSRRIKLLEAKRLAPKLAIFLVEVDGKTYLFSQSGEQFNVISASTSPIDSVHKKDEVEGGTE